MKVKALLLSVFTAVLALGANAQFLRLEVDEIDNQGLVPGRTFRVYAVFGQEGDVIDAVYGEKSALLEVKSSTGFYQHERGGGMSSEVQKYDLTVVPELAYDSWVTIGREDNYMNHVNKFNMDFSAFDPAGGAIATDNGAWFVTPDKFQAKAGASKRILLMQLTSEGKITGVINIHGLHSVNGGDIFDEKGVRVNEAEEIRVEGLYFEAGE